MPLLNDHDIVNLRADQARDATERKRCPHCEAHVWKNYCRQCDEFFTDGHYATCAEATQHQVKNHRRY